MGADGAGALSDPAHLAALERYDMEPAYMNSEDYAAFVRRLYQEVAR